MSTTSMAQHDSSAGNADTRFSRQWHYRPEHPIGTSPVFQWPPKPASIARWFAARWLVLGENLIVAGLAILTWLYFQPPLEETRNFAFGWFAQMLLRNAILITIVAGGLHILLYIRKSQGNRLKFDPRDLVAKSRAFTFNSQLRDNMFWTLTSGVFFWTAYEAFMLWAMANGYAPMLLWGENPLWFVALFLLTPLWISFHFYWVHRVSSLASAV